MENRKIKSKDLRLARIKYFDVEHNGAELTELEAYAFIQKAGDVYINVFDGTEDLPVLERSIYPNVMRDGEEYGNKLIHVYGQLTDGPCYVVEASSQRIISEMERVNTDKLKESVANTGKFFVERVVDTDTLKEYMFNSDMFFVDRMYLIGEEKGLHKLRLLRKYHGDLDKMDEFKEYIASHEKGREYRK